MYTAMTTIRGQRLFHSELRIVWLLYSRVATIQEWRLFVGSVFLKKYSIAMIVHVLLCNLFLYKLFMHACVVA